MIHVDPIEAGKHSPPNVSVYGFVLRYSFPEYLRKRMTQAPQILPMKGCSCTNDVLAETYFCSFLRRQEVRTNYVLDVNAPIEKFISFEVQIFVGFSLLSVVIFFREEP